jgi:hypothetical protein
MLCANSTTVRDAMLWLVLKWVFFFFGGGRGVLYPFDKGCYGAEMGAMGAMGPKWC